LSPCQGFKTSKETEGGDGDAKHELGLAEPWALIWRKVT